MNYKFKYPPILIGGRAMEYYKLRKSGKDIDYIVHPYDYNKLKKLCSSDLIVSNSSKKAESLTYSGGKIPIDYYLHIYQYDYSCLKNHCLVLSKPIKHLVISLQDMILIKSMTAFDKKPFLKAKSKHLNDISLVVNHLLK